MKKLNNKKRLSTIPSKHLNQKEPLRPALLLLIAALLTSITLTQNTQKTVMLIELTRHGARAPLSSISKLIPRDYIKQRGISELTAVGMRQHYLAGRNTAARFPDLFSTISFKSKEYEVRSTDVNRTLESAFSHMFGVRKGVADFTNESLPFENSDSRMLPPQDLLFDPDQVIDFRTPLPNGAVPFPIHAQRDDLDLFLGADGDACPVNGKATSDAFDGLNGRLRGSKPLKELIDRALELYNLKNHFSDKEKNFHLCYSLGDFATQDYVNNPQAPLTPSDELYRRLRACYSLGIIGMFEDKKVVKSTITQVYQKILHYFKDKVNTYDPATDSFKDSKLKYVLYSAHDNTLAPFLIALGVIDPKCIYKQVDEGVELDWCQKSPPLASSLQWELIRLKNPNVVLNEDFGVRFSYNGDYINVCGAQDPKSTQFICKISDFEKIVSEKFVVEDLEDYCGLLPKDDRRLLYTLIFAACFFVVANLMAVCSIISYRAKIDAYRRTSGTYDDKDYASIKGRTLTSASKTALPGQEDRRADELQERLGEQNQVFGDSEGSGVGPGEVVGKRKGLDSSAERDSIEGLRQRLVGQDGDE